MRAASRTCTAVGVGFRKSSCLRRLVWLFYNNARQKWTLHELT